VGDLLMTFVPDELKGQLLEMGICEVLIPLTNSPSSEVQGNSAAALGNLSSKGKFSMQNFSTADDLTSGPSQMAEPQQMITPRLMMFGINPMEECINIFIGS
jgi:hypothetical protein